MPLPDALEAAIEAEFPRATEDLKALLRIPSVSARNEGLPEAASLVERLLRDAGLETRRLATAGPDVLFASAAGGSPRTLLLYDHYDVQPEDPIEEWKTPPFEPTERDGRLFARGAADNKGDLVSRIACVRAFRRAGIPLPCTLKLLAEGDEEIGSPSLEACVRQNRDLLAADACLWESSFKDPLGNEMLMLGVKGILYLQLECRGPRQDLHSSLASSIENPAWRLLWALAALKGPDGRVRIPGFYDDVEPPSPADMEALRALPDLDGLALQAFGVERFVGGARGLDRKVQDFFRPTMNVAGLTAGYQGSGSKTVLPGIASAKVDLRLVRRQDPEKIVKSLRALLDAEGFPDVRVARSEGYRAARTPVDHPAVGLFSRGIERSLGKRPLVAPNFLGSGPLWLFDSMFPTVAWGLPTYDGGYHAPNEWISLDDFRRGIRGIAGILLEFGAA